MQTLKVRGKNALCGSVKIPGAKNSALPIMAASVLCEGKVQLSNIPNLSDVNSCIQILNSLGCDAKFAQNKAVIDATHIKENEIPEYLMRTMRSSLFFLAPILVRKGTVKITTPGGCNLGSRPIDIHLNGLSAMGAKIKHSEENKGEIQVVSNGRLNGADFTLHFPSVGASETLLMAAATAKGRSILRGVAKEPEVIDLANFLQSAGAKIKGIGTDVLQIEGALQLNSTEYKVCPDRITAATVLCAVASCSGEVLLSNCDNIPLQSVINYLQLLGTKIYEMGNEVLCVSSGGPKNAIGDVYTGVYPAFPTDIAPVLMAACLKAKGKSRCTDTIFEQRFACSHGFNALGANTYCNGNSVYVQGVKELRGANLTAPDLRGGAALVIGAMQAEGESIISGVEHINRGYEDIALMFNSLGAHIEKGI